VHGNSERVETPRQKPGPVSDVWYYADGSGHIGPFSLLQFKATLLTMPDPGEALVWCPAFDGWKRASDVPELWSGTAPPRASSPSHAAESRIKDAKEPRRHGPRWWWFVWLLSVIGSSRAGREEMGRLSKDRLIIKETRRWVDEGPPDILYAAVELIRANLLFVLVSLACLLYGLHSGVATNSLSSGLIAGVLAAAIINFAILALRKFRLKKPSALVVRLGTVAYWAGWSLAFYGILLMVYRISHIGLRDGLDAAVSVLPSVIFYPAAGWCIRYMLGDRRRDRGAVGRIDGSAVGERRRRQS
jgi:hypothetical protein